MFSFMKPKKFHKWNEKDAPKESILRLKTYFALMIPARESYNGPKHIAMIDVDRQMVCSTDSPKQLIKEEIGALLEEHYKVMCILIDQNDKDFTEGFWQDLEKQKQKEDKTTDETF